MWGAQDIMTMKEAMSIMKAQAAEMAAAAASAADLAASERAAADSQMVATNSALAAERARVGGLQVGPAFPFLQRLYTLGQAATMLNKQNATLWGKAVVNRFVG
jgi:hypothetical protein